MSLTTVIIFTLVLALLFTALIFIARLRNRLRNKKQRDDLRMQFEELCKVIWERYLDGICKYQFCSPPLGLATYLDEVEHWALASGGELDRSKLRNEIIVLALRHQKERRVLPPYTEHEVMRQSIRAYLLARCSEPLVNAVRPDPEEVI